MTTIAQRPEILDVHNISQNIAERLIDEARQQRDRLAASASGLGGIDASHPLALGLVARNGPYQANHATRQADVLLALGVRARCERSIRS